MAGHSRSKNGVASLAYVPVISLREARCLPERSPRDKRGDDDSVLLRSARADTIEYAGLTSLPIFFDNLLS
jgi:hypothetical protein